MIKQWHIDSAWQEPFVARLKKRGASPKVIDAALEAIDDRLAEVGESAQEHFGDPEPYADDVVLPGSDAADRSRGLAIGLVVLGLIGMALTLVGWTGHVRDADTVLGMTPMIPTVLGLVLALGAAVADAALGAKADVYAAVEGGGAKAVLLNKLAPWIIVALTFVGMVMVWVRWH